VVVQVGKEMGTGGGVGDNAVFGMSARMQLRQAAWSADEFGRLDDILVPTIKLMTVLGRSTT